MRHKRPHVYLAEVKRTPDGFYWIRVNERVPLLDSQGQVRRFTDRLLAERAARDAISTASA